MLSTWTQVENVESVSLPPVTPSGGKVFFNETIDHSKWALTVDLSSSAPRCTAPNGGACADSDLRYGAREPAPWVCVGDINREYTQYKRPGGQLCILHADVHAAYLQSVAGTERCPGRRDLRPQRTRNML